MRKVWKFELAVTDVQKVTMPAGARLLHVGLQHDNGGLDRNITLWAWVDSSAPPTARLIAIIGTGNLAPEPSDAVFVGTVLDGPFVWHVFDGGEVESNSINRPELLEAELVEMAVRRAVEGVGGLTAEMREKGIHVGLGFGGDPGRCVTCGEPWPCSKSEVATSVLTSEKDER